jgi:hypothetical protein
MVLEVINDVCRDEFIAQHFFEINGEVFFGRFSPKRQCVFPDFLLYNNETLRLVHHILRIRLFAFEFFSVII